MKAPSRSAEPIPSAGDSPQVDRGMRISGFSIARRAIDLGYPIQESLRSMLPLVDELIVNVGDADDGTWEAVQDIGDPKISAFRSTWDLAQPSALTLSEETNKALARCRGEWAIYLQADEVLHEAELPKLHEAMRRYRHTKAETISLCYYHFYRTYSTYQDDPRGWYRRATRVVRTGIGIESVGDGCAFKVRRGENLDYPRRKDIGVRVYHYGWVRDPDVLLRKQRNLERLYHSTAWLEQHGLSEDFDPRDLLENTRDLRVFTGAHPAVMHERIAAADWQRGIETVTRGPSWLRRAYVHGAWLAEGAARRLTRLLPRRSG